MMLMSDAGYVFGTDIKGQTIGGQFVRTTSLLDSEQYRSIHRVVNTHKHGIYLLHSMDIIKSAVSMQTRVVKVILERLFRKSSNTSKNLVVLDTNEFYAFVINNARKLKQDFKEVTAKMSEQLELPIKPKTFEFKIP